MSYEMNTCRIEIFVMIYDGANNPVRTRSMFQENKLEYSLKSYFPEKACVFLNNRPPS